MSLNIYDSMKREKVPFVPLNPPAVGVYVCGLTVYDHSHIGHARMLVAFDVIVRHLRASGFDVTYVRNITDIDDKIIVRANENGESIEALTARYIESMHTDCAALNVLPPDIEPHATDHIDAMLAIIETLIERDLAYAADNGDVYYRVKNFANYGALSGKNPADLRSGARIDVNEQKEDPLDFVLWKAAKEGEPSWDSPYGKGRPGWHIECSAMSDTHLGPVFDIHGGGMDLKFPHHENEIAQSCGASGKDFARHWLHNGFVQVDNEKMSKSLHNFFTIRDVLKEYRPEEMRFFLIGAHYRKPINYSQDELEQARACVKRLYTALEAAPDDGVDAGGPHTERFVAALDDDFNTPGAIAVLFELARDINRALEKGEQQQAGALAAELRALGARLGVLQDEPEHYLKSAGGASGGPDDATVDAWVAERNAARAGGDYARADEIRDRLTAAGITVLDGADGTAWRRD